jgi:4-hydroxybenzoyl-CoA reductase subunit beta
MNLPRFELLNPATVKEALSLMGEHGESLRVLAGGTEIVGRMKHGLVSPAYVMSLKRVKVLAGIKERKGGLVIGATTTLSEIAESRLIADLAESVREAARLVAAPAIRNVATVAGNLLQDSRCLFYNQSELVSKGVDPCYKRGGKVCHAVKGSKRCFSVYQGDLAPALVAVGAHVKIEKTGLSRTIPVEDLFSGKGKTPIGLAWDELLTEVILPVRKARSASTYQKFRIRGSVDYPLASAAVFVSMGKNGAIEDARIILGAAGAAPKAAIDAAAAILGKKPRDMDQDVDQDINLEQVASLAAKAVEAVENLALTPSYRRKVAAVLTRRALEKVLKIVRQTEHAGHA